MVDGGARHDLDGAGPVIGARVPVVAAGVVTAVVTVWRWEDTGLWPLAVPVVVGVGIAAWGRWIDRAP